MAATTEAQADAVVRLVLLERRVQAVKAEMETIEEVLDGVVSDLSGLSQLWAERRSAECDRLMDQLEADADAAVAAPADPEREEVARPVVQEGAPVIDLMDALQRSVDDLTTKRDLLLLKRGQKPTLDEEA